MEKKSPPFFTNTHIKHWLLYFLLLVCYAAFAIATILTAIDLKLLFFATPLQGIKELLVNVLGILAIAELIGTLEGYQRDGRIRVTYIIDTAIILMLKEVLTTWYRGLDIQLTYASLLITCVLVVLRIISIQFSPDRTKAFAQDASLSNTKTTAQSPQVRPKTPRQRAATTS